MNDYKSPAVTVDGVIFQLIDDQLCVLLVRRQHEPFKDIWALPGGYISYDETSLQALRRVLKTKAVIAMDNLEFIEQLYTFDTPAMSQGSNAISIVYYALRRDDKTPPSPGRQYFPVSSLPKLAYEHTTLVEHAHERLKSKIMYTNALFALLPDTFTLSQLQNTYEAVLGQKLDKRNFRKKFLQLELISATDDYHQAGAHRPARLYRFNQRELQSLSRSFS